MSTGYYKGKLRLIDVEAMLAEPPDPRPLFCPDCSRHTTAGWCTHCGLDWLDGCADQLRAANPHIYSTAADMEQRLITLSTRYIESQKTDGPTAEAYRAIHSEWMEVRAR